MTTPPPEGSSKATGGIARGKASGNRPNIADLDDNYESFYKDSFFINPELSMIFHLLTD